jgi:DUF4097 and DUF4098 domain-containing protein YvlB
MKRIPLSAYLGVLQFFALAAASGLAQDFHKTYTIGSGGQISIANISGDVTVSGYKGDSIIVDGYKSGPDKNNVTVEDNSSANRLELRVQYPEHGRSNASISFEVKVPQSVEFNFERVRSISGNISVIGVKGRVRAECVSGNVEVKGISGIVSAQSISGNVDVEILNLGGSGEMKFSSVSGNVSVRAPSNLNADIEMSTVVGSLKCDFPIEIQERRYGPGSSARGRLGNGANNLRITSVSGRVSLSKL